MSHIVLRPYENGWPFAKTSNPKQSRFDVTYTQTVDLLKREVDMLGNRGTEIVIQIDVAPGDIRRDGNLRASARTGYHGVVVSFDSKHGPLRYGSDEFHRPSWGQRGNPAWHANLRAVALGLEALRLIERYGIARDGQQYRGWNELGTGTPMGPAMTVEQATAFMESNSGLTFSALIHAEEIDLAYRRAAKRLHPDQGGSDEAFRQLTQARDLLLAGR